MIVKPEAYVALTDLMFDVRHKRQTAKLKALDNLARYKFSNFGYWAAVWVQMNSLLPKPQRQANPFRELVHKSRELLEDEEPQEPPAESVLEQVNDILEHTNDRLV